VPNAFGIKKVPAIQPRPLMVVGKVELEPLGSNKVIVHWTFRKKPVHVRQRNHRNPTVIQNVDNGQPA